MPAHIIPSGSSSLATQTEPQQRAGGGSHPGQLQRSGGEPGVTTRPGCRPAGAGALLCTGNHHEIELPGRAQRQEVVLF